MPLLPPRTVGRVGADASDSPGKIVPPGNRRRAAPRLVLLLVTAGPRRPLVDASRAPLEIFRLQQSVPLDVGGWRSGPCPTKATGRRPRRAAPCRWGVAASKTWMYCARVGAGCPDRAKSGLPPAGRGVLPTQPALPSARGFPCGKEKPARAEPLAGLEMDLRVLRNQRRRLSTLCEDWLACASMAVPACCRICVRDRLAVSLA